MQASAEYLAELTTVARFLEEEEALLESQNAEMDKQVEKDMEEIETLIIPDSPVKPANDEQEEEDNLFESMNAELDKQIAQDMEAIRSYISTNDDSYSKRAEFFNNIDNSHINKCVNRTLTNHILVQHTVMGTLRWHECTLCDYRANEKEKLREHMALRHSSDSNGGELKCDQCSATFLKDNDLLRHKKAEHGLVAFVCDKCDFITVEQGELGKHVLTQHLKLNVSWYKCAKCAYRTAKKVNLDRHVMYKHSEF